MAHKYMHLGIRWVDAPKTKELEPVMGQIADDWLRYGRDNWLLWTEKSLQEAAEMLRRVMPNDQYMLLVVDVQQAQGRMPKFVWDWINKPRPESQLTLGGLYELGNKAGAFGGPGALAGGGAMRGLGAGILGAFGGKKEE